MRLFIFLSFISLVLGNTEKVFLSSSTRFKTIEESYGHLVSHEILQFPFTRISFSSEFGNHSTINSLYALNHTGDIWGEIRVCWPATIPLSFEFEFVQISQSKFIKLSISKSGVKTHLSKRKDILKYDLIAEQLLLRSIPISFIPVSLEIAGALALAWLLYPIFTSMIDDASEKKD